MKELKKNEQIWCIASGRFTQVHQRAVTPYSLKLQKGAVHHRAMPHFRDSTLTRILELLGWNIFRSSSQDIIKSNHQPRTAMLATKPCPISTHLLNTPWDSDPITSLGNMFQWLRIFSMKKFLLISSLNLPWHNFLSS